ncbi:MAG: RDD family protein [Cellulomonas sp.]|jgi:hypothetical protein|nr:RDD family protein [Cellulomonas sp.]
MLVRPAEVPAVAPRLMALAVDQLLVVAGCLVTTVVWLALGGTGQTIVVLWLATGLLVETGQAFAEAISGATLGSAVTHVRTVSARTGWPAGLIAVVVRRLVLTAGGIVLPVLGAYVVAGSGEWSRGPARRGWHDWAADTLVLRDWAVPDRDERDAERSRRRAARSDDASERVDPLTPAATSADGPTVAVDDEPLDHRTATTLDVRPADGRPAGPVATTSAPNVGPDPVEEPALGLTSIVPIVVPDLRSEPEERTQPRARHRATTLGLGRPRPYASSGRHRVPEIPTQRTPPRDGWPRLTDDLDLTATSDGQVHGGGLDGLRLVFDCGVCVEVAGNGAVGRDLTGVQPPPLHPVVVDDPKRTVSRVHLRFGLNPGRDALWVMDENSTNGTVLVRPDGSARVLPAGVPVVVGVGWQIRFGERSAVVAGASLRAALSTVPVEGVFGGTGGRPGLFLERLDQVPTPRTAHLSEASNVAAE